MNCAPIALFVYKRPDHARQTVEALRKNQWAADSDLIVFSDGARSAADEPAVRAVREYLAGIEGFKSVCVVQREENLGLARSVIDGVTDIVTRYGKVIVLEDDLVTSPHFLRYMNEALEMYRDVERVISIHGYVYPAGEFPETFFLKGADCWGWATWARGWALFEPDGERLYRDLKRLKLERYFDFDGSYPYTRMLKQQAAQKNSSWAVRWYASALLNDRLTLYPGRSLVSNIGNDDSGTHCTTTAMFEVALADTPIALEPIPVAEDPAAYRKFADYFRAHKERPYGKAVRFLRRMLHS